ncbi:hypothetical protein POM88_029890 [Heracleum sosnowskyi]|uniref:Uncharacterized protein n=1 Tax=Heracleum sosnowskyi TaxID=360622 RepID=A0AAD8MI59_9APIA|nr:hypothetical protein POM88_029890 [Heracleum sosnowskyi]
MICLCNDTKKAAACSFEHLIFRRWVIVQGPDPKGLKMRRHAFHHYNSGKTTLSASGMLVPSSLFDPAIAKQIRGDIDASLTGSAFVLTVASVIEPFLSNRDNLAQQPKNTLIADSQIDIMIEKTFKVEKGMGAGLNPRTGSEHEVPEKGISSTKPRDHENIGNSRSPPSRLEFSDMKSLEGNSYVQKVDQFDLKAKKLLLEF